MPAEFDTNILVYAYDRTAGSKFDRSRELMEKLWDTGEGVVSTQILEEFYVTVTAKIPNRLKPGPPDCFGLRHLDSYGFRDSGYSRGE
jgi:predicted nucleic acid-binding protein